MSQKDIRKQTYTTADLVASGIWDPIAHRLNHLKHTIHHASDHARILQGLIRVLNDEIFQENPLEYIMTLSKRPVMHYINEAILKMLQHIHNNTTLDIARKLDQCDRCGATLDIDKCILDIVHNRPLEGYAQKTLDAAYLAVQQCKEFQGGNLAFRV